MFRIIVCKIDYLIKFECREICGYLVLLGVECMLKYDKKLY